MLFDSTTLLLFSQKVYQIKQNKTAKVKMLAFSLDYVIDFYQNYTSELYI